MSGVHNAWPTASLVDLVDILDSRRSPVKAADRAKMGGNVPYYGATGRAGAINRALFNEPLILLGEDGAPFFDPSKPKAYLIDGPAWVNNHAHVLRPKADIDRRFLRYYLDQFDYRGFANGTTRLKLTQAAMKRIPVPVAPLNEQRRIVDVLEDHLSRLDAGRHSLTALVQRANLLVAASFHQLLDEPVPALHQLGQLAQVGTGTTPLRSRSDYYTDGSVPWITSGDLTSGTVTGARQFVTHKALEETSLRLYPEGTLLVAMYGEGKTRGTVADLALPASVNQACAAIQLHDQRLVPWVRAVLQANYLNLRRMAAGGVQPNLNLRLIRTVTIPMPIESRRDEIVAQLNRTAEAEGRLKSAMKLADKRAAHLRRAVLAAAFSGRLTGRSTDIEVIEELAG